MPRLFKYELTKASDRLVNEMFRMKAGETRFWMTGSWFTRN